MISSTYDIYLRHRADAKIKDSEVPAEVVLDIAEIPFVSERQLRGTVVHKIKMSDDHSMVAFTVDVGNTEVLKGGVKDMRENRVLDIMLPRVGQIEFGGGENPKVLYFTESDSESNRPSKVKRLCLETKQQTTIFVDDDPTHYIDIGVTKD